MRATIPASSFDASQGNQTDWFRSLAVTTSHYTGRPIAFIISVALIVVWGVTGPLFGYSDAWQLVINTGTTIVTFLMVFLIQATQNRDAAAIQLKLDELLRAVERARNEMIAVEDRSDEDIGRLKAEVANDGK
ncbi:MAG TPA: low affinity iron permease family protein [Roseiarcus sp.]|nr:low affinity iron permease family protein [Roseiarcus sp.]